MLIDLIVIIISQCVYIIKSSYCTLENIYILLSTIPQRKKILFLLRSKSQVKKLDLYITSPVEAPLKEF